MSKYPKRHQENFYRFHDTKLTYEKAKDLCETDNASLVTIKSGDTQTFIDYHRKGGKSYWLDLRKAPGIESEWLWQHADGTNESLSGFTAWGENEPIAKDSEECSVLVADKNGWKNHQRGLVQSLKVNIEVKDYFHI